MDRFSRFATIHRVTDRRTNERNYRRIGSTYQSAKNELDPFSHLRTVYKCYRQTDKTRSFTFIAANYVDLHFTADTYIITPLPWQIFGKINLTNLLRFKHQPFNFRLDQSLTNRLLIIEFNKRGPYWHLPSAGGAGGDFSYTASNTSWRTV